MLDHISFSVKNYEQSLKFYDETLQILGYKRIITIDIDDKIKCSGYGDDKKNRPSLWISPMGNESEEIGNARGVHISFVAHSCEEVIAWYQKCLEFGAKDNGKPGPRPEYHDGYFGAFVVDPNGWRIEASFQHYGG